MASFFWGKVDANLIQLNKEFSPTVGEFINSTKTITILIAPLGEGKTFGCIGAVIAHAQRCDCDIRCAWIRDTLENIKLSIVPSVQEFFQDTPQIFRFKNEYKELTIWTVSTRTGKRIRIDVDLFGIDDPAAMGKLQGSSAWTLIWLNEPAAQADKANAGLSVDVYRLAVIRAARHTGTPGRVLVDMNPADESHWTFDEFIVKPDVDDDFPLIQKQVWQVPYGENKKLKQEARQAAMKMYANSPAEFARYVQGQFAVIYTGEKVTPYYRRDIHLLPYEAEPVAGLESFRLWDSWGSPCCVLGQISTIGRLLIYNVCLIDGNSDLRVLISTQVNPLLNSPRWKGKARNWRDIGDFTMAVRDQSNVEESSKLVIQRAFKNRFEPGPSTWKLIKQGMDDMFERNGLIQGLPSVQIDPVGGRLLDRALNGAWHYPTDNAGRRTREKPVKDAASHAGDAFANGCAVLRPSAKKADLGAYRANAAKVKKRAQSYAVGGMN